MDKVSFYPEKQVKMAGIIIIMFYYCENGQNMRIWIKVTY